MEISPVDLREYQFFYEANPVFWVSIWTYHDWQEPGPHIESTFEVTEARGAEEVIGWTLHQLKNETNVLLAEVWCGTTSPEYSDSADTQKYMIGVRVWRHVADTSWSAKGEDKSFIAFP